MGTKIYEQIFWTILICVMIIGTILIIDLIFPQNLNLPIIIDNKTITICDAKTYNPSYCIHGTLRSNCEDGNTYCMPFEPGDRYCFHNFFSDNCDGYSVGVSYKPHSHKSNFVYWQQG